MKKCPLLHKDCIQDKCMWWTSMEMRKLPDPQVFIEHNCAISWLPKIMVEGNRLTQGVGQAVESRGNEAIKKHDITNQIFAGMAQMALDRSEKKELGPS